MIAVLKNTLEKKQARKIIPIRLLKAILSRMGIYAEYFPRDYTYDPPEFNPVHFQK